MSSSSSPASAGSGARQVVFRYQHLASRSGGLAIVVLREPESAGELLCDGEPMIGIRPTRCSAPVPARSSGEISAGEWLVDHESGLTLICPYGGSGILTFDGRLLRPLSMRFSAEALETGARQ